MRKDNADITRRGFVKSMSAGVAGLSIPVLFSSCMENNPLVQEGQNKKMPIGGGDIGGREPEHYYVHDEDPMPKRILGKTGLEVSALAFGGGSQFLENKNGDWEPLMERALALGVNYFDTCFNYGTEERFAEILSPIRDQVIITTKFDDRTASGMRREFEGSLKRLKTDYVDILMIHAIAGSDSRTKIEDGVYKEMLKLKDEGQIRFIGFSSMDSASSSRALIERLDFDVVMLALNATTYGGFAKYTLPSAVKKNVGVMAMKVMRDVVGVGATAEELMHYALDQEGVSSAVIGHYGMDVFEENAELVKSIITTSSIVNRYGLEQRLKPLAGPHALCWARDDYYDGKMV